MNKIVCLLSFLAFTLKGFSQLADSCKPHYLLPIKELRLTNGKLAYIEAGKGKTIIFIHGLGGSIRHWEKSIINLSDRFHCIAIDLPGYGASDTLVEKTADILQAYAKQIFELLQAKNINRFCIAGHSMGGQLAIIMALQQPQNIEKLMLLAPAGLETFTQKEGDILKQATTFTALLNQSKQQISATYFRNFFQLNTDAEKIIYERQQKKDCPNYPIYCQAISDGVKGMLFHKVADSIHALKMPVLLVFGKNDQLIPNPYLHPSLQKEQLINEAQNKIPNCKTIWLPAAGHLLQVEKNEEINQQIHDFLTKN